MDIDYKVAEVELTYKPQVKNKYKVMSAKDAYSILLPTFKDGTITYREYFKVLFLNNACDLLGYTLISQGGLTNTMADVRIILQAALLTNATSIILAHNHPSGNLKPSREDIALTENIKKAAQLLCISVIDHIIMSEDSYYSFSDEGRI